MSLITLDKLAEIFRKPVYVCRNQYGMLTLLLLESGKYYYKPWSYQQFFSILVLDLPSKMTSRCERCHSEPAQNVFPWTGNTDINLCVCVQLICVGPL